MPELWFWLLAFMLGVYVVLDGFDFGAGMLYFLVGRTRPERATLLRSLGPVWDGNEVWLIAAGGTLFGAFPALYAITFSGFYLPLMMVLWLLLGRALGIEIRHQLDDPMWHQFWDAVFCVSSLLLAVFFGAALANLVRGVPLDASGNFFEPLWTDFRVGARTGILDWYTVLTAVTATLFIGYHGALWLALKTEGALRARSERLARLAFWPGAALTLLVSVSTFAVQPQVGLNLSRYPAGTLLPVTACVGLVASRLWLGKQPMRAFIASGTYLLFSVLSAAFAVFPQALTARDPRYHLSLQAAAASEKTQLLMLCWWLPGIALAIGYSYYNYTRMPRTFREEDTGH